MAQKQFAVFDIDGTLFRWQLFHQLIFELIKQGQLPLEIEKKVADPLSRWHNRAHPEAFREYEHALFDAMGNSLSHVAVAKFEAAANDIVAQSKHRVYRYTRDLVASLKARGYFLIALSGSFQEIVTPFAAEYGFDIAAGIKGERRNGYFTGKFDNTYSQKGTLLKKLVAQHNLSWKDSIGVGDTKNDIPMLALVEQPIAFNPNQELYRYALEHHWNIVIERKNVTYQLAPDSRGQYVLATK